MRGSLLQPPCHMGFQAVCRPLGSAQQRRTWQQSLPAAPRSPAALQPAGGCLQLWPLSHRSSRRHVISLRVPAAVRRPCYHTQPLRCRRGDLESSKEHCPHFSSSCPETASQVLLLCPSPGEKGSHGRHLPARQAAATIRELASLRALNTLAFRQRQRLATTDRTIGRRLHSGKSLCNETAGSRATLLQQAPRSLLRGRGWQLPVV